MKLIIRCTTLREVTTDGAMAVNASGIVNPEKFKTYVEASFEAHQKDNVNFYISIPTQLLDDDMRIGDEYEVTFTKKV